MASLGSHGDHSQYLRTNPDLAEAFSEMTPTIGTGVEFFRNAVRNEIKMGADFIKIMINGGFSTPNDTPDDQQLCDEEIEVIIKTAHELEMCIRDSVSPQKGCFLLYMLSLFLLLLKCRS